MDSYNSILKTLKKEDLSIRARLQSIIHDTQFVSLFKDFPLVANERCGLWYIQPHQLAQSVYFKSTDGHTSQWNFSTRRLNFHLLLLFKDSGVVILVDLTRKGKLMPDALLKTVPIWCAVLNYIMFEGERDEKEDCDFEGLRKDNWLVTPREMVSESEHHAIVEKIPEFAREVLKLNLTSKEDLMTRLGGRKPVVPHWVYPGKTKVEENDEYFNICCLTASARKVPDWQFSFPYVQGAGDDHELWATSDLIGGNFDHAFFWDQVYYESLEELRVVDLTTGDLDWELGEEQFMERIGKIYERSKNGNGDENSENEDNDDDFPVEYYQLGGTGILLGKITGDVSLDALSTRIPGIEEVIVISPDFKVTGESEKKDIGEEKDGDDERVDKNNDEKSGNGKSHDIEVPSQSLPTINMFPIESSKKGAKILREKLPQILQHYTPGRKLLVLCNTGKDLSVGVTLCVLSKWFSRNWEKSPCPLHVNKDIVKQHLSKIQDYTCVNPSRNTLQSVNTYLMGNGR